MTTTTSRRTNPRGMLLTLAALLTGAATAFGAEVREEFHQTYPLGKAGVIRLENVNGSVRITAWDREEIQVDAVKRAKKQEHLDVVGIEVDSAPDKIRIKTKYPAGRNNNNSTSVDYTLTVPRACKLGGVSTVNGGIEIESVRGDVEASSVNGQVSAKGLVGEIRLATVNGSVKATVADLRNAVSLKTVNGSLTLALPPDANADVSADAVNGGISSDLGLTVKRSFPRGQKLEGKLGQGGPQVKLSTVNGSVHIDRAEVVSAGNQQ